MPAITIQTICRVSQRNNISDSEDEEMGIVNLIASIAGTCTTVSFLPQVIKVYRTRHTKDLSLPMYVIFSLGALLWACYGIAIYSLPVIIANSITFILSLYILAMKLRYK